MLSPKVRLGLTIVILLALAIAAIIVISITLTPRSIAYAITGVEAVNTEITDYAEGNIVDIPPMKETTLLDVLYDFSIIRTDEDLDDSDYSIDVLEELYPYTDDPLSIPMYNAIQIAPQQVISMSEFVRFSDSTDRILYYSDLSKDVVSDMTIVAYNLNLRRRQTAIFVFMNLNGDIYGYVLNDVWMRGRQPTTIHLLMGTPVKDPILIIDLDSNVMVS